MESPGKYLRVQREFRNLSLQEISYFTKVREHYLRAIEEDRFELLPSAFYAKGFLTLYARCLDIDPNEAISRYQKYIAPPEISVQVEPQHEVRVPKQRAVSRPFTICLSIVSFSFVLFLLTLPTDHVSLRLWEKPSSISEQIKVTTAPTLQEEQKVITPSELREMATPKEVISVSSPSPQPPAFIVLEASIGSGIELEGSRLTLTGKCSEFSCDNRKVYFLTRIMTPMEGKIIHVWRWKGKEFHRKEIEVKPPAWSVYSYIVLRSPYAGDWNVEVRDVDKVLATLSFKASEPAPDSGAETL